MGYVTQGRLNAKAESNNLHNTNKNICALHVAQGLGVADSVRYLHTIKDVKRAASTRFKVRSVQTRAKAKGRTVGAIRGNLKALDALAYIVQVEGHVMLLDCNGITAVDTDPRKRDNRPVLGVWGVYHKEVLTMRGGKTYYIG